MLKKSLLFFEEFYYITPFTGDIFLARPTSTDISTRGHIHNVAGRGLITSWPSTQQSGDSEEIADTCVWPENSLLVDIETTATQS